MQDIRIGIVGSGTMGFVHFGNFNTMDGARVTALADPHEPPLDAAGARCNTLVTRFSDYRDLAAADVCDAVIVATPNMTHADVLLDLPPTDLHLLVEKPLGTRVSDCKR